MPLQAKVKSVLSGDTLILVNQKGLERTLSLAYVSAPRLRREGDEPFAFQAREFLRERLIDETVLFDVLYTIPNSKREYGTVKTRDGKTLPAAAVAEGWLKVREDAGRREETEETKQILDELRGAEAQAKAASRGVWGSTTGGNMIETLQEVPDPKAFVEEWKGKDIDSVIERVIGADRLRVRLILSPQKHIETMLVVAGIRAPSTKRTVDGKEQPAEAYGTEAFQFVEPKLLQRRVPVRVLGVTPQNQLVGSVLHPNGNIAKFLLEAGLARCSDHHSTMLGAEMAEFRKAEQAAKEGKKGLFTGHTGVKGATGGESEYTVHRVLNADTVFIRTRAGEEKKVSLSSIRQPKPSDPKQSPFSADAKEFLRKKLIGKHVKVKIDGKKPANEGFEEREVATVTLNNKNVALGLVEAGYASVIRHRRDDEDRSQDYDALLAAEEAAQKDEKGMWSAKPSQAKQYQDYSESLQKAKMEASVLQRQKKVPAVVDFVKSGGRFTLLIPRENAKLTFVLSGIRVPKSARSPAESSEPFGDQAHELANKRCTQRDVEIDVEGLDKVGGFIGTLFINRENFARVLVEEGFAEVHAYSAEQSGHGNELFAAEKKAKEERKGRWHDWDPSKDEEEQATAAASASAATTNGTNGVNGDADNIPPRKKDYRDVVVTHVDETGTLKLQQIGASTTALSELMNSFKSFHLNKANDAPLSGPPKAGDIVAAKFTEDEQWYRAKIRRNDRDAEKAEVVYFDYGNSELIPWTRMRPLSQPQFSTQKLRPQATDAVLSYLQLPTSQQYLPDTIQFIGESTMDRQLVANVDYVAPEGTLHVTLFDPRDSSKPDQSVNADVVQEGLAMVPRKLKNWEKAGGDVLAGLKKMEEQAKEERKGMWEYGDLTED